MATKKITLDQAAEALDKITAPASSKVKTEALKAAKQAEAQVTSEASLPAAPAVRAPSKTRSVLPTHQYTAPKDGSFYEGASGVAIPSRDIFPRKYLVLIASPDGCTEHMGRRVNVDRGPTIGGFGPYTAKMTGISIIVSGGVYRVGMKDASGVAMVATEEYRKQVFDACGGQDYLDSVISRLGPDIFMGLPVAPPRKTKEKKEEEKKEPVPA